MQTTQKSLTIALVKELRDFLLPLWERKQAKLNPRQGKLSNTYTPDKNMCRFTSGFLLQALDYHGFDVEVKGGAPFEPVICDGGFKDANNKWHGHFWVIVNETIIDLTAEQFGCPGIVISDESNPNYLANITGDELDEMIYQVDDTASEWFNVYISQTNNQ